MPSWVVEKPLKRKLVHLWCKFVILTVFEICHIHIQLNALHQKKKSPFSFKTLLRFSKPFSCSKLLLYLIYPESILAEELIGFGFKSRRVLKHGSLQIRFDQDISFGLVKSCSWLPGTRSRHISMYRFRQLFGITKVGLLSGCLCYCRLWVTESFRPLTTEVSYRLSKT